MIAGPSAIAVVGATVLTVASDHATARAAQAPPPLTRHAAADAHASAAAPGRPLGAARLLRAGRAPRRIVYVRFSLRGLSGTVESATLRLFKRTSRPAGLRVARTSDAPWTERTLTYRARPRLGPTVARTRARSGRRWLSVDVGGTVAAGRDVTFALTAASAASVGLAAREAGRATSPHLVVTTRPSPPHVAATALPHGPAGSEPAPSVPGPPSGPVGVADPFPAPATELFERRPYSAASPWNTPIEPLPAIHPLSAEAVALIGGPITSNPEQYTYPLYFADASTPRAAVTVAGTYSNVTGTDTEDTDLTLEPGPVVVEAPLLPHFRPAAGTDSQLIVVDPQAGDEWGFFELGQDADGAWTATSGYHYDVRWDGHPPRSGHRAFASRGAGVPYFAGLVRPWEVERGRIEHALAFGFGGPTPTDYPRDTWVYPATKSDGVSTDPRSLPAGARLQLDPLMTDIELRALGCDAAALVIAHAMQEFGMIVVSQSRTDKIMLEGAETADWARLGVGRDTPACIPLERIRWVAPPAPPG